MKIKDLNASHLNQVMDLFCSTFMQDSYYIKQYPSERERLETMRGAFANGIGFCIEQGYSFGAFENDKLVSFLLAFDYNKLKDESPNEFVKTFGGNSFSTILYADTLHAKIQELKGKTMFLLSIAVDEAYRRMGIASAMVDYIMDKYEEYNLVSDVSNEGSLEIYKKRGFEVEKIDEKYYLIVHEKGASKSTFSVENEIRLIIPQAYSFKKAHTVLKENVALCGYNEGEKSFIVSNNTLCFGKLIQVEYNDLLDYQREIGLSVSNEILKGDAVFYASSTKKQNDPLVNDILKQMLKSREHEWSIIADTFVSIPMKYTSLEKITSMAVQGDDTSDYLLKNLDFRTYYELGIMSNKESVDEFSGLKKRIKRYYLGKIKAKIVAEPTLDNYSNLGETIGAGAYIDMYISVDTESSCAILTWYSLSLPFLISHYFDNIIRNHLVVQAENGEMNIFDYLSYVYGIVKRGTPKIYAIIPKDKDCLSQSQIASLLASETIYPEGEDFGRIVDRDIMDVVESKLGMGQYDRAMIYAYNNVLLQFCADFKGTVATRLEEEAICQFFIELVLFEEAAIQIADRDIAQLFVKGDQRPIEFLESVDKIHDEYSKTIDFWNVQLNYPTSQNSINMLRRAFKIESKHDYMQRNQQHMEMVFETKRNIVDRKDSKRMDTSLAIISVLAIFSAWMDSHSYVDTWKNVLSENAVNIIQRVLFVIILITASYAIMHLLGGKIKRLISKIKKRRKK